MATDIKNWEYTKIVATIGPASDSVETLEELMRVGMNVARLNTKHGTTEWHAERVDRIRQAAKNVDKSVAVLLDLQGPEIRINIPEGKPFELKAGDPIIFTSEFIDGEPHQAKIPQNVIEALEVGNEVSTEDGFCEFVVTEKHATHLVAKAQHGFMVGDRKTMNTPGVIVDMPSLIPSDMEKLEMLNEHPVDFIALSFVRDKKDIEVLREEMKKRNIKADIVAKIENQAAIDNLDEIIEASEAVMVARGDLAVEIPMEQLTYWQKEIIRRCRMSGKPVITATQMLKSMVDNPRPTRAEVSDVANAVFDGTDAIMLSEETTIGKYVVKTVATMRKIARFNERHTVAKEYEKGLKSRTTAVTKMAVNLLNDKLEDIDKVVVLTETGYTARQLTRHRPFVPVIAVTDRAETQRRMSLLYSVIPVLMEFPEGEIESMKVIIDNLKADKFLEAGEKVLMIHGTIYKTPGFTNTVTLLEVM